MARRLFFAVLAWALLILPLREADAATIWASDTSRGLWQVDTTTGDATLVGSTGTVMWDIAFSPSGALFGISSSQLFSIDPSTAASTLIGDLGVTSPQALDFDTAGTLFLATEQVSSQLYTVNTSTGATSPVGNIGFQSRGDLAFAPDGSLFMSARQVARPDELIKIDTSTGVGSVVGPLGFEFVLGMDFSGSTLFAVTNLGEVLTIDTLTGAGTLVANTRPRVSAIGASTQPVTQPVPEPGSLVLLSASLAGLVAVRFRRRRGGN